MKTSFYFIIWIIIYPLLGLLHNVWIDQNAFIVALLIVWGLSWLLNRSMPRTLRYERVLGASRIMEDIYTRNFSSFKKRLHREMLMQFLTAIYFGATLVFIGLTFYRRSSVEWFELLIFSFFAIASINSAYQYNRAYNEVRDNENSDTCISVAQKLYRLNYNSYYSQRAGASEFRTVLPPEPRNFRAFQIFSFIVAVVCGLLALGVLIMAIFMFISDEPKALSAGVMYFLYGTLALNFGIKDAAGSLALMRKP